MESETVLKKSPLIMSLVLSALAAASHLSAGVFEVKIGKWFAQGKTSEIEEALAERITEEPANHDLWLELAEFRKSQGDYPGTVAAYQEYLSAKEDWKVKVSLALAVEQMGQFTDAEGYLKDLFQKHPREPDILWGLARLCLYQSKWKELQTHKTADQALREAQKYLAALTALKPEYALGFWQLAEVSRKLGDTKQALEAYEKAVKIDPSFKKAYRYIAMLLGQRREFQKSLAEYEKAMDIDPQNTELKREVARIGKKAPKEEEKLKADKVRLWEKWVPPPETAVAPSSVTIRVGLFTGLSQFLFRGESELEVANTPGYPGATPSRPEKSPPAPGLGLVKPLAVTGTPTPEPYPRLEPLALSGLPGVISGQEPITVLTAKKNYEVDYVPAKKSPTHKEFWVVKNPKGKVVVKFDAPIWIVSRDPSKALAAHAVPSNMGYFFAKEEDRAFRGILGAGSAARGGFQCRQPGHPGGLYRGRASLGDAVLLADGGPEGPGHRGENLRPFQDGPA